jgi:hypothetical protein
MKKVFWKTYKIMINDPFINTQEVEKDHNA